jgi:hypothetical protein
VAGFLTGDMASFARGPVDEETKDAETKEEPLDEVRRGKRGNGMIDKGAQAPW